MSQRGFGQEQEEPPGLVTVIALHSSGANGDKGSKHHGSHFFHSGVCVLVCAQSTGTGIV